MTPSSSPADALVDTGVTAFRRGSWIQARDAALAALRKDSRSEGAWLLLSALAAPFRRAPYLRHILEIHPASAAARSALEELENGRGTAPAVPANLDLPPVADLISSEAAFQQAVPEGRDAMAGLPSGPEGVPPVKDAAPRFRWAVFLISISCLLALLAAVFGRVATSAQELPVMARVEKARDTVPPTFTPSFTPTVTPSFTPTFTPTSTFTPSFTPSPTKVPTHTPVPTIYVPPPPPGVGGEHWVDVDISSQTLTAYAGDTPIRTFLVSTGVAKYPTVIGRFHIYARYLSTLMQGQGYYLPNVPYTQYFYEGYSLHGTYWHHNFGHPMSHGCVNMYTPDAAWMWNFATYGTLVNIHW